MRLFVGLVLLALAIALSWAPARAQGGPPPQAVGEFKTIPGESVGNVTLTQLQSGEVYVSVAVKHLPPGTHGIHIHERGTCAPDFMAAGGHYNPTGREHGLENPDGPHAGDLPNLMIEPAGVGNLGVRTDRITITPGSTTIFDADGSAMIIHAHTDDQRSNPAGNSGDRIACAVLNPVPAPQPRADISPQTSGTAEFKTSVGETVGTATLTQNPDGSVRVQAQVRGLPPGTHGFHIHQFGACAPTFGAAGEHFNPTGAQHGLENPNGPHAGDLPNFIVGDDGMGSYDATTNRVTLMPGPHTLFDTDGSAIIIHAHTDDQKTDPGGNSGSRIACAVLQPAPTGQAAP